MITDIISLAVKLLNIGLDAYMHKNDDHATTVKRFEAALEEGKGLVDKMKAGFAADDAAADAEMQALKAPHIFRRIETE